MFLKFNKLLSATPSKLQLHQSSSTPSKLQPLPTTFEIMEQPLGPQKDQLRVIGAGALQTSIEVGWAIVG